MKTHLIRPGFLTLLLVALLSACANTARVDIDALRSAEISNFATPEELVYSAGQPTQDQIQVLANAGVQHVISLRTDGEIDWDERAAVEGAGMRFYSIPVSGQTGITPENAESLQQLLARLDGQPVLVHCGSSNRVGALRALTAHELGASLDDSLAEGRRWGMTRLEERVRGILSN